MDYLWSPWRYKYLTGSEKPSKCIFCTAAIAACDEEVLVVFRGVHNFGLLNRFPYTTGHLMIAPYQHVPDLAGIDESAASEMMTLVRRAEQNLKSLYRPDGINLGMNIGEAAGAGVAGHIHMHVLPRWTGDANFMTTVGETRVLGEELEVTWRRMREAFGSV